MSKKTFNFVVGIFGGIAAIASVVVAYVEPSHTPAIIGAIGIVETAITEICSLFVENK